MGGPEAELRLGAPQSAYLYAFNAYRVVAPLVLVIDDDGRTHHLYTDATIHADSQDIRVTRLLEANAIEEIKQP